MTHNFDELELSLLEAGGVDNWSNYDDAISDYLDETNAKKDQYGDYDVKLTSEEKLEALNNGGVDNWSWYGESLKWFSEYKDYVKSLPEDYDDDILDFYSFVEQTEAAETVRIESERVADELERESTLKAEEVANLERMLKGKEYPQLYDFLKELYPLRTIEDIDNIYLFTITKSKLFLINSDDSLISRAEYKKISNRFLSKNKSATVREFTSYVRQELIDTVIKNGSLKRFVLSIDFQDGLIAYKSLK